MDWRDEHMQALAARAADASRYNVLVGAVKQIVQNIRLDAYKDADFSLIAYLLDDALVTAGRYGGGTECSICRRWHGPEIQHACE